MFAFNLYEGHMTTKDEDSRRLIQSVSRATTILGLYHQTQGPLGITEIARLMNLPKTTISGLVTTLTQAGFMEKTQQGKYSLGPELFRLGICYATNIDVVTLGRAWIERLCFQFRQPVNLGMLVNDKVALLMRKEPDDNYMVFPQAGSIIPSHSTAIGKILLAHMEPQRLTGLLDKYNFEQFTANTITDRDQFMQELQQIRQNGVGFDNQECINELSGIGGPVFNHEGRVIAAFAISGDPELIDKERAAMIEAVKLTSRQVSAMLGYLPQPSS